MLLGCIADDFTGAGDIANTLARGGMRTRLFVGSNWTGDVACEAGVIALKTRSIDVAEAVAQSLAALELLRDAGCRQIVFKYCSTFDSTRQGNIGPVAEALATALDARGVVVCPAYPATGRTVYQGHLFVGDRLLSQSGMENHPLTPMPDPDIRRWLAHQAADAPGHVALDTVRAGHEALRGALEGIDATLVIVDAVSESDLHTIGRSVAGAALVTGGSGVALGLPANFVDAGAIVASAPVFRANRRPALLLSGSCSRATREQVAVYAATRPAMEVDVAGLARGDAVLDSVAAFIGEHAEQAPLIYSTADPERVAAAQAEHGSERMAHAIEHLFGALTSHAVDRGFGRIVVAGGETAGAVVTALGLSAIDIGPEIDPGVPALSSQTPSGSEIALALKSGNFGVRHFFEKAVSALGNEDG